MRPRDWFNVGVRLLGVWMILAAVGEIVAAAEVRFSLISSPRVPPGAYLFHAAVDVVIAILLLTNATNIFWPEPPAAHGFEVTPKDKAGGDA